VNLLDCIETLKKFHATRPFEATKETLVLSVQAFSALRQMIAENLGDTIEHLTRYVRETCYIACLFASKIFLHLSSLYRLIGYAFNCGGNISECSPINSSPLWTSHSDGFVSGLIFQYTCPGMT
jgi:hypothetical protein